MRLKWTHFAFCNNWPLLGGLLCSAVICCNLVLPFFSLESALCIMHIQGGNCIQFFSLRNGVNCDFFLGNGLNRQSDEGKRFI